MKNLLLLIITVGFVLPASAENLSWQSIDGKYSAKGQDGCADTLEVYHQTQFGVNQLHLFSEHEGQRNKEVVVIEGEWITGPVGNQIYHYGFKISSPQGDYITYLRENSEHSLERKLTIRITAMMDDSSVAFFSYYDDIYSLGQSKFCIYERLSL